MLRLLFLLIFLPNLLLAQIEYSTNEYNSLWSIAIEVKKDNPDFSLYQIMIAIQDLNPDSFKQGNINFLKKDQLLKTPDLYLLDIYDRYQSIRDVAEQNSLIDWHKTPLQLFFLKFYIKRISNHNAFFIFPHKIQRSCIKGR